MPKKTVILENGKKITLTDGDYVASGGEGAVYKQGNRAFKIYHDPKKTIPEGKIKELSAITPKNVLGPKGVLKSTRGMPIGFIYVFQPNATPLCKFFTKSYRKTVGFTEIHAADIVRIMQETVEQIHRERFLIVDLNEMNFLISRKMDIPYFLDVDSWQTPSYKATALMESVRDRQVKNQKFTTLSDWFSFAVVAFQLYIGIHPYKGKHPDYKPKDWSKRMDDGASIFDSKCIIPSSCRPMDVIPKGHLGWFKDVFANNNRSAPPLPEGLLIVTGEELVIVKGNENFHAERVGKCIEDILSVHPINGQNYTLTQEHVFMTTRGKAPAVDGLGACDKVVVCESPGQYPIVCRLQDNVLYIEEILTGTKIGDMDFHADDIMSNGGRLYSKSEDSIFEHNFIAGKNVIHNTRLVCKCLPNSTQVFDGVVYQDMLGQPAFIVPYQNKSSFFNIIKEIRGYRVLDAKAEDNVLVVLTEKSNVYYRFIVIFNDDFSSYTVRKVDDVVYDAINFVKIPGGPCILSLSGNRIEVFVDNSKVKEIDKTPFDTSTKLFHVGGKVHFVNGKEVYSVTMK